MRTRTKTQIGKVSVLDTVETPNADDSTVEPVTESLLAPISESAVVESDRMRWLALVCCCIGYIHSFYNWALIGNLQSVIKEKDQLDLDTDDINWIFSYAAIPAVIFPFVGGVLVDRLGLRKCYLIGATVNTAGYIILTSGIFTKSYALLILGMVVAAIGDGPMAICNNGMIVKWFVGKELSLALGASVVSNRLGSSASAFFGTRINKWTGELYMPFVVGLVASGISYISTIILVYIDKKTDDQNKFDDLNKTGETAEVEKEVNHVGFKDIKRLKPLFWLLAFNVGVTYSSFFGFMNNANDILKVRFGFSVEDAGLLIVIIYMTPIIFTPTVAYITDNYGKRLLILMIAGAVLIGTNFYIAFLPDSTEGMKGGEWYLIALGLFFAGAFYASYSAIIWPCVALICSEKLSAFAYALALSAKSLLGVFHPKLMAFIKKSTLEGGHGGYFWTQITCAIIAIVAFLMTVFMYFLDLRTGGRLNSPGSKRKLTLRERIMSVGNAQHS